MANEVALGRARSALEEGRAAILKRHREGAGGQEVVRAISALTDGVISDLFQAIAEEAAGKGAPPLSLVATGGYGRRELAPRSDIDLLALLPGSGADSSTRRCSSSVTAARSRPWNSFASPQTRRQSSSAVRMVWSSRASWTH